MFKSLLLGSLDSPREEPTIHQTEETLSGLPTKEAGWGLESQHINLTQAACVQHLYLHCNWDLWVKNVPSPGKKLLSSVARGRSVPGLPGGSGAGVASPTFSPCSEGDLLPIPAFESFFSVFPTVRLDSALSGLLNQSLLCVPCWEMLEYCFLSIYHFPWNLCF